MIASNNKGFQNGLNIHLLAFALPRDVIQDNEDVRVSITSIPEEIKQNFIIEGKKMGNSNHVFSLNITNETKKIIMVFRKQSSHSENPIIASSTIKLEEFKELPRKQITNGMIRTEVKHINIYYPLQRQIQEEGKKNVQRKVLGQMEIQLTFTASYSSIQSEIENLSKDNNSNSCKNNNLSFFKKNKLPKIYKNGKKGCEYEKLIDDNSFCDNFLN